MPRHPNTKLRDQTNLWQVHFQLLDYSKLTQDAAQVFDDNMKGDDWIITQNGHIVHGTDKNIPEITLVVDVDDPQTVRSLKMLPYYFAGFLSSRSCRDIKIKVCRQIESVRPDVEVIKVNKDIKLFYLKYLNHYWKQVMKKHGTPKKRNTKKQRKH